MKNLYVFYDSVSGHFGDIVEADNDLVMRRSALPALASVPPYIACDTIVLHIASISSDDSGLPVVEPCAPRNALSGASPEVAQMRSRLMDEANRLCSVGGDSVEE